MTPGWFAEYEKIAAIFNNQTSSLTIKLWTIEWEAAAKGERGETGIILLMDFPNTLEIEILAGRQFVNPTIIYSGHTLALETRPYNEYFF